MTDVKIGAISETYVDCKLSTNMHDSKAVYELLRILEERTKKELGKDRITMCVKYSGEKNEEFLTMYAQGVHQYVVDKNSRVSLVRIVTETSQEIDIISSVFQ